MSTNFNDLQRLFAYIRGLAEDDHPAPTIAHSCDHECIQVGVPNWDNEIIGFQIKKTTPMHKLMTKYGTSVGR